MLSESGSVFLCCGPTDMRKSICGLAAIVEQRFGLNVFNDAMYVFCGRSRDKLKILQWQHNGFWLYYRRLERGKFAWPSTPQETMQETELRQLRWMLDGLRMEQAQAHTEVHYKYMV